MPRIADVPYWLMTDEDKEIWNSVGSRPAFRDNDFIECTLYTDRRDADVMLFLATESHWSHWNLPPNVVRVTPTAHVMLRIDVEWPIGHACITFL